jgi:hypothetical protein
MFTESFRCLANKNERDVTPYIDRVIYFIGAECRNYRERMHDARMQFSLIPRTQ